MPSETREERVTTDDPLDRLEQEVEALEAHVAQLRRELNPQHRPARPQLTLIRGGRDDG